MSLLELRPATEADRDYVRRTQHAAYKDMVIRQFGRWEQSVQDGFFDRSWKEAPRELIVIDGEPCGFCRIDEHATCLQLVEFAVDMSKQGRGIGSRFLTRFKAMASAKGKVAQLNVMKTNAAAKALYERCGFSVYGENENQFLMRSNHTD